VQSIIQIVVSEIAENWPAFIYIGMMIGFSILFFRERRAEAEALRQIGTGIHERIDRVESLIKRHLNE
jgi:hypothetical protein